VASFGGFLEANWFNIVQTISIVLGLVFAGLSLRKDNRGRRLANLLSLKAEHRELWNVIHDKPEFARILKSEVDLATEAMTPQEEIFLRQMIVHFAVSWELLRDGTPFDIGAFRRDAGHIFSLPLPNLAWQRALAAQNPEFARFINNAVTVMRSKPRKSES
jgi:hypothetical protein